MANVNAPMGFRLISGGGKSPRRRIREVASNNAAALAPGDAYVVANNVVTRATASAPNGIVEGIQLQAKDGQGPESADYLPINTAGYIIGIEDADAEFEVQVTAALEAANFDAGGLVDVVDGAPDATLRQSRQYAGDIGGSQLSLVALVDRPDNVLGAYQKVRVRLLAANVI